MNYISLIIFFIYYYPCRYGIYGNFFKFLDMSLNYYHLLFLSLGSVKILSFAPLSYASVGFITSFIILFLIICNGFKLLNYFWMHSKLFKENTKKIAAPAKTSSNNIKSIISKAINDSNISEKDYVFINDKLNRYHKSKECIRKRILKVCYAILLSMLEQLKEKDWLNIVAKKLLNLLKSIV